MSKWLSILAKLAELAVGITPTVVDDILARAAVALIEHLKGRTGLDTKAILQRAGAIYDENDLELLEHLTEIG